MKETRLKKLEWILGLAAAVLFALGVVFKYILWPGAGILGLLGVFTLILFYLPVHYIRHRRKAKSLAESIYLILKLLTWSFLALGGIMLFQHWVGGSTVLMMGKIFLLGLAGMHLWMGIKKIPKASSLVSDLVAIVFLFALVYIVQHPRSSKFSLNNQQMMLDYYQAQVSGIKSANKILYQSIDSSSVSLTGVEQLQSSSREFHREFDSIMWAFVQYCNAEDSETLPITELRLNPMELNSGFEGEDFFFLKGNSKLLVEVLSIYSDKVESLKKEYHLSGGLIGSGLERDYFINPYGDTIAWEYVMFLNKTAASIMESLFHIKQMAMRTENAVLNGLLAKDGQSMEMDFLQELAARESDRAMKEKEDEIMRIRQGQALQALQLEQSQATLRSRNLTIISAFSGIALVLILLIISTRAYLRKQKDNRLLKLHRDEIKARNGEITSSIEYARRLQASILPSPGLLRTRIKDHFVLFMPKQSVSGDFYWWTQIEDNVVITAADCTGHGVPGAFMSMLGVSMLREIVSKEYISHPGVILRRLRKEVIYALKQTGEMGEQKDGMDMALVSINVETLECQYAGANNPLYLLREGELTEYKPDRMPISIHQDLSKFHTHDIQLLRGDRLFMFSDGYADQFGGPMGKKFKYMALRQVITESSSLPMEDQKKELENTITEWMSDCEQIDDILILGLEI